MTRMQILAGLSESLRLLQRLRRLHVRKGEMALLDYALEAERRIEQLLYLIERFAELEQEHETHNATGPEEASKGEEAHAVWAQKEYAFGPLLELHAEAFYYFAWRARQVLRNIPALKGFNPVGVGTVRHKLIEHADAVGGVMSRSYMFACPQGFILKPWGDSKPGRKAVPRARDRGLYPNASEFVSQLLPLLRQAVDG